MKYFFQIKKTMNECLGAWSQVRQYLFYAFEEGDETAEEPRNQITKPRNVITASKKKKEAEK